MKETKQLCVECNNPLTIPSDSEKGEIITCQCCGCEFELKIEEGNKSLVYILLEGDDYGE